MVQRLYESSGIEAFETYLASTLGRGGAPISFVPDSLDRRGQVLEAVTGTSPVRQTHVRHGGREHGGVRAGLASRPDYLREKAGAVFTEAKLRMRDYIADSVTLPSVGRAVAASLWARRRGP